MAILYLKKTATGLLIPAGEGDAEVLKKFKTGANLKTEIKEAHNYKFLQKMHCLAKLAYDHFCEHNQSTMTYRGQLVTPDYTRFRKDLTILAGHYTPVFRIDGEVRLEAKSWAYDKATNEERERIFSDFINAALKNVYKYSMSEAQLRDWVESILHFDR